MSLVDSLLGAIVRLEGDSLVLHTGEKPYVVTSSSSMHALRGPLAWGQVELSTRTLTSPAVMSILEQLLDRVQLQALDEIGAVEYYIPETSERPSFQVVAARGGEDIWVEVRPVRPSAAAAPAGPAASDAPAVAEPAGELPGTHIEVVDEVRQEQPDAAAVAALVASSGLATPTVAPSPQDRDEQAEARARISAALEEEERRLAAAREDAARAEAGAREEAARLAALKEEAERLEHAREEAARAAAAAREDADRAAVDARVSSEALEQARREKAARVQALRDEVARLEDARAAAVHAEERRLEALRAEAALAEAAAMEEHARVQSLRDEAVRLEAARDEAARAEAAARVEAARVEALRREAERLEAARAEAAATEAAAREEAARVARLREEASRLEAARDEAARVEAAARAEAARLEGLRQEVERLESARAEAAAVEAAARAEAARIAALRDEAARLEAAREDAARIEAMARAEAARIEALRDEAARAEAARAEAARVQEAAREEAARTAAAAQAQRAALEQAQREIQQLREAIRSETERLESARSTAAAAEEARQRAEREEQEHVAALREAQRLEEVRLEELRAQATKLEAAQRDQEAALQAQREEARSVETARRDGEERLQALVAALRDDTRATRTPALVPGPVQETRAPHLPLREPVSHVAAPEDETHAGASEREPEPVSTATLDAGSRRDEQEPELAAHAEAVAAPTETADSRPAHVLPLVRGVREQPAPPATSAAPDVERLLRIAAARGASGLYLVTRSHPAIRVDGDMQALESEEPLAAADIEALMLGLAPEPSRDSVKSGATVEWFCDVPEIGRVRCLSFRDHRGPGVIIRMLPARAVSAEQLGLSREIQALSAQPDGLVLIVGPRASGKSTMLAAFVDLINRTRADHVVTVERQVTVVHQSQRAFVSQREVRGEAHEVLAAVRAALREDPDVLVIEELRSPEVVAAALESAESGRLVIAGLRAPASAQGVERLMNQVPADRRTEALSALSTSLRGVVSQVLLRKRAGGRVAARELLLNTPAAAAVLADGKLFQLGAALEGGRKLGSVPLNDSLVALIREGTVDPGEAWRKAYDREGLLTLLKREGIDTSFVERLA